MGWRAVFPIRKHEFAASWRAALKGGLDIRAGRRAALKGGPAGCRKRRAAEQGGLHIYTCRRAVEKGGSFDSRTDCVKNYFFSQLQMFIALYNMAERSMQGRTALNIIELASFRRSLLNMTLLIKYDVVNC